MRRYIVIMFALMAFAMPLMKAQTALDIEGLITQERMIARYGEPDSVIVRLYPDDAFARYEHYYYGDDYLQVVDGDLIQYYLKTSRFSLFNDIIEGGVKVGDPVSKILNSTYIKKKERNSQYHVYDIWIGVYDDPVQVGMDETETYIANFYYYYVM